jgi:hypothetical protein
MAQDTAAIVGDVTDSTGAAMPGVKVVITDVAKGIDHPTTTDAAGAYKVGFLGIGKYNVTVEAPGFEKYLQTSITLTIGQILRVDVQMKVGATTQEVTVNGNVVKVQTEDAVMSSVVVASQITSLNLDGRQFTGLLTMLPGTAVENSYSPTAVGKKLLDYITTSGTRMDYADWEQDGGTILNLDANGNFHTTPSLDSIGEFKANTSQYSADQGISGGVLVEMSTKSGTKDFHGDMYEFVRNQMMDSNPFFTNRQIHPTGSAANWEAPKAVLKWNDWGYTFGGPLYIPNHYNTDKSKTFFFWSEEWRRVITAAGPLGASVPTARMRAGDFSECLPSSANFNANIKPCTMPTDLSTKTAANPTGTTYPAEGKTVPMSTEYSDMMAAWVPLPNNGPTGWTGSPAQPIDWRQEMIRVDQNIGNKMRVYARYTHEDFTDTIIPVFYTSSSFDTILSAYGGPAYNWTGHMIYTFTPTVVNDFMLHWDWYHNNWKDFAGPDSGPNAVSKPANWSMQYIYPANSNQPYMPGVSVSDPTISFAEDAGPRPDVFNEYAGEMKDDVAVTKGNHFLRIGALWVHEGTRTYGIYASVNSSATTQGELVFSPSSTLSTGSALADMMLGNIYTYTETTAVVNGVPKGGYSRDLYLWDAVNPYLQDDWHVTKRLTVNLGVRTLWHTWVHHVYWDQAPTSVGANFIPSLYNPAVEAPLAANGKIVPNAATGQIYDVNMYGNGLEPCGQGVTPVGCLNPNGLKFMPRIGFAWQPTSSSNTVIRGGYGLYYMYSPGNDPGYGAALTSNPPTAAVSSNVNLPGYTAITPGAFGPAPIGMINPNQPTPSTQQWSLGVQHAFKANDRFSISYVGNVGTHLARTRNFDMIPIGVGTENVPALAGKTGCDSSGNCPVQSVLINNQESSTFFLPYQGYSGIALWENSASSNYHGLQSEYRHTFGHGLTTQVTYTWSHMIDDAPGYSTDFNVDDSNMHRYYSTSGLNRTQVFNANYIYDLPFFKNNEHGYVKNSLGGWQLSGITSFWTGTPLNFGCSISGPTLHTGIAGSAKCNSLGPVVVDKGIDNQLNFGPTKQWYNPATVGQLQMSQLAANGQAGMFGYMGNYPIAGPGRNNFDIALLKNIQAPWFRGEHSTVQFRWETYNTFNHTQFQGANAGCGSTTPLGQPCTRQYSSALGDVSSAWTPRLMQLGLKFIF